MKYTYRLILFFLAALTALSAEAQTSDTTAAFFVEGVCGQCRQRIQKAASLKGVKKANWDAATRRLTVTYSPSVISLEQIHRSVAASGHDTDQEKAPDEVYHSLPACCLYRDGNPHDDDHHSDIDTLNFLHGIVVESREGRIYPLEGATIRWSGTQTAAVSNSHGEFRLPKTGSTMLVISHAGFRTDSVVVNDMNDIEISLSQKESLGTVVITARRRSSYIDNNNPFRVNVITKKELLKAACCNLSESFETNPSVDVSYNDAVTGSRQIQLLGLAGNYTQLTVENLPGPRGIATPLGLNSIAGPWVESIQLIKGAGSVVNGYESIAGQINVELQKPREAEKLYLNGYVNNMGKTDVNLNLARKLNDKWSAGLLLHDDFLYNNVDFNKDGFRDLPTGNQFSGVHRWQYLGDNGLMSQFGLKAMFDTKTGGHVDFEPAKHRFGSQVYGLGIDSRRWEAFGKIGYVFPERMYRSIGFEVSAFDHTQDAYFGQRRYDARQKNFYSNLIYITQIKNESHQVKSGLSFLYDQYNEDLDAMNFKRNEAVPGVFTEYTYKHGSRLDVVAGLRVDHNSIFGLFVTPRLNIRFEPVHGTTLRLSAGRGQRTANIFAENMSNLVSSRNVILPAFTANAYGLNPEVAWNKGISIDQRFKLFGRESSLGIDFYRNDFTSQVVVDLEDPRFVKFYDLDGRSFSNSLQAEIAFTPVNRLDVRMAYRYFDVRTTIAGELREKPFTARHRAFTNLAYDLNGWKMDYTANFVGPKRIPSTLVNPEEFRMDERSSSYITMNAQISRAFGKSKQWDLYIGGENLTNFFQENAIISAADPFSPYFDASMIWGPVSGRNLYFGFRYKIH